MLKSETGGGVRPSIPTMRKRGRIPESETKRKEKKRGKRRREKQNPTLDIFDSKISRDHLRDPVFFTSIPRKERELFEGVRELFREISLRGLLESWRVGYSLWNQIQVLLAHLKKMQPGRDAGRAEE